MEKKRKAFPRFYFLSDDELIDILANSKDLDIIQKHLKACFDNVVKLTIVEEDVISEIHSGEKEVVKLKKVVRTKEVIEKWLDMLQSTIKETLHSCFKDAAKEYNTQPRPSFVKSHYGQIVASMAQI
jgi:dynein heavy chain